jgi:hypothetical protein
VRLRTEVVVAGAFGLIGVATLATIARIRLPLGEWYAAESGAVLAIVMIVAICLVRAITRSTGSGPPTT